MSSNSTRPEGKISKSERQHLTEESSHEEQEEEQKHIAIDSKENEHIETNNTYKKYDFCPILHPYGAFKITWDLLVSIVIIISAIEIPLTMTFDIPVDFTTNIGIISFCIDIFLCCDICVTFRTAYFDEWDPLRLIINPKVIATRYAKTWFAFDFITSFPFNFIFGSYGKATEDGTTGIKILRIVRLFRLLRVFRIYKMLGIMREMNRLFPTLKKWFGITQVMVFMLFVAHYFACIWFAVGKTNQRHDRPSWLDYEDPPIFVDDTTYDVTRAYSTCFYWSIVTLFTTGYGDITAHYQTEQWCAIFVIVVGSIMTAYLVGTLTVLAFEGDIKQQYLQQKLDEAYSFGAFYRLSNPLIRAITAHIEYHCNNNYVASDPKEFVKSLPQHLRTKIEHEISGRCVREIDIFKGLSNAILGNIAIALKGIGCNEGYKLFIEGDTSSEIYLLRIGAAKLIYGKSCPNTHQKFRLLQRGDMCGEGCLIAKRRRTTLVCLTWCEFFVLRRENLKEIIWDHHTHEVANKVWENMKEILRKNVTKHRKMQFVESDRLLKTKAKANLKDTVYDDLYSVDHTVNGGFIHPSEGVISDKDMDIEDSSRENAAALVDKMRDMRRIDSGLKDFKQKQHYKMLYDVEHGDDDENILYENKEQINNISVQRIIGDRQGTVNMVELAPITNDSRKLNVIIDDEDDEDDDPDHIKRKQDPSISEMTDKNENSTNSYV